MQEMTMEDVGSVSGGRMLYDLFMGVGGGALYDGIKAVVEDYRTRDWGGPGGAAYSDPAVML